MARYLEAVKQMPDVDEDKVALALEKIQDGSYDQSALDGTVDALMEEFGL